jgi:hypothetical protein
MWTERVFGLPPRRVANLMAGCFGAGALIELFMLKVWVRDTNCALPGHARNGSSQALVPFA